MKHAKLTKTVVGLISYIILVKIYYYYFVCVCKISFCFYIRLDHWWYVYDTLIRIKYAQSVAQMPFNVLQIVYIVCNFV